METKVANGKQQNGRLDVPYASTKARDLRALAEVALDVPLDQAVEALANKRVLVIDDDSLIATMKQALDL